MERSRSASLFTGVERLAARLAAAAARRGTILCFHGVTQAAEPGGSIHLAQHEFSAVLDLVQQTHRCVPVAELVARHLDGRPTRGLLAVTFDDAYTSVARSALPELARRGMPACLFAVSSAAQNGSPYWWDRMELVARVATPARWRALEQAAGVPSHLSGANGRVHAMRSWVLETHRGRWPVAAEPAMADAERELSVAIADRSLSLGELARLAGSALVQVGVHTVTHANLSRLSDAEVAREVAESYRVLRDAVPVTLPILAAPYGLGDERVTRVSLATGMKAVLSVSGMTLVRGTPLEWVPRFCLLAGMPVWKVGITLAGWLDARRRSEQ